MAAKQNAYRLHLKSGSTTKTVMLRELKIKDQTLAAKAVGSSAGTNQMAMAMSLQQEIVKLLLISIDEKPISPIQRENLDDLFSLAEYQQVASFVSKLMGGDEKNECPMEIVSIGGL